MIFFMILFYKICWRRWRELFCEKKLCEIKVGVCFTTCSRCTLASHCCGRPPTSCRAFLLRTLDRVEGEQSTNTNGYERKAKNHNLMCIDCSPSTIRSSVLRRPALHSVGSRPQTPHPPPPKRKPKVV